MAVLIDSITKEEFWEGIRQILEAKETPDPNELITYKEITEVYGVTAGTVVRKVNASKLPQQRAVYAGRTRYAITRKEAEKLFKRK